MTFQWTCLASLLPQCSGDPLNLSTLSLISAEALTNEPSPTSQSPDGQRVSVSRGCRQRLWMQRWNWGKDSKKNSAVLHSPSVGTIMNAHRHLNYDTKVRKYYRSREEMQSICHLPCRRGGWWNVRWGWWLPPPAGVSSDGWRRSLAPSPPSALSPRWLAASRKAA